MTQTELPTQSFLLLTPGCDLKALSAFEMPADLVVAEIADNGIEILEGEAALLPEAISARVLSFLACSADGAKQVSSLAKAWVEKTGQTSIPVCDLSGNTLTQESISLEIARLYALRLSGTLAHNAQLLGSMASLRSEHEQVSGALSGLERMILDVPERQRMPGSVYGPLRQDGQGQFTLERAVLRQRVHAESFGLSDLAVFLPDQNIPGEGYLQARLALLESGDTAAEWRIPAAALEAGWVRFSLERALSDDTQTPVLELSWEGEGKLMLGAGPHHPDRAFCARFGQTLTNQMLAMRVWRFLPGMPAPLPSDGHWSAQSGDGRIRVEPGALENALPVGPHIDPDQPFLQFFSQSASLQVHPRVDMISAALLQSAVAAGVREISARIGSRTERSGPIEYALAIAPRHTAREASDLVAQCERDGRISDWVSLNRDAPGNVSLLLKTPVEETSDLVLLTRLAPGASDAFGWAMFRNIWMRT